MIKLLANHLAFIVLGGLAAGLALRHDVAESKHLELGARFPAVAQVGGLGSGTLVARDWVLTAAHVPEMLQRMRPGKPLQVQLAGLEYEVDRVELPEARKHERERHDIALLHLAAPVPEELATLAIWQEDLEPGTKFVLAGWGILAQGDAGLKLSPEAMALPTRRLRAGWNQVESCDAELALLTARFDGPDTGLELEAGPCIGDSGGPAMVRVAGEGDAEASWRVAGVIALVDDTDGDGIIGEYGEEFGMTLVAAYADWIATTIETAD